MVEQKCLVVDDEPIGREIIKGFLSRVPGYVVAAESDSGLKALELLKDSVFDIIFLDINMPGLSGMEVARVLKGQKIIFTTAYPEYAVEGFEVNAIDYLVKPIPFDRFVKALDKVSNDIESDHIWIKSDRKQHKVLFDDILLISSMGDYIKIHVDTEKLITHETMKNIAQRLPEKQFIRVHKSYIVNINAIQYLEGNRIRIANEMVPIGASYREYVAGIIT